MRTGGGGRCQPDQPDPFRAVAADLTDGQPPAGQLRPVPGGGDPAEEVGDEAG